ncbi:MAG: histidine phosphatase family protein [Acidobacteria bacterium]|nr:histidine phosphatase family protein [Acidobacteriota bacterium]
MREIQGARRRRGRTLLVVGMVLLGLFPAVVFGQGSATAVAETSPPPEPPLEVSTIFLVRHAEKATEPKEDPPLTAVGRCRAEALAELLADAGIHRLFSTETRRTLETVRPLAVRLHQEVETRPPADLDGLVRALTRVPGEVELVVGHSNTLGPMIEQLGAPPIAPIADGEYGGIYVVTRVTRGAELLDARVTQLVQPAPYVLDDGSCAP